MVVAVVPFGETNERREREMGYLVVLFRERLRMLPGVYNEEPRLSINNERERGGPIKKRVCQVRGE